MPTLFELLSPHFPSATACASALGMTRQAFSQAHTRARLSDRAAIRAAGILGIDPANALLINATHGEIASPITHPAPRPAPQPAPADSQPLYYVKHGSDKKQPENERSNKIHTHSIASQSQIDAVDLIRWVLAVANIQADSPRFLYYVSRWAVPDKISAAKSAGTFDATTAGCPAIDPAMLRHVPAALSEYRLFKAKYHTQKQPAEKSSRKTALAA
jgi:hypothetical protein